MGLILNTYFAIEAPRSTFWTLTGVGAAVCGTNRDHQLPDSARFCPECASAVVHEAAEEATPVLAAFAGEMGVSPSIAFAELVATDGGWFWTSDKDPQASLTIRWYSIERCLGVSPIKGLGFQIGCEAYLEPTANQLSYSLIDLAPYHIALLEVAQKFNITGTPKLWVQAAESKAEPYCSWDPWST